MEDSGDIDREGLAEDGGSGEKGFLDLYNSEEAGMINIKGVFKSWEFTQYTIRNEKYCLWVSNGFSFFRDYSLFFSDTKPFLAGIGFWLRWRLWREYKREISDRAEISIKNIIEANSSTATEIINNLKIKESK